MILLACLPMLLGNKNPFLYQVGGFNLLQTAAYDGNYPVSDLPKHGVMGVGTFNGLDGEMVVVDSKVYQINGFGEAKAPAPGVMTPFAFVCVLGTPADKAYEFKSPITKAALQAWIDSKIRDENSMVAIRIDGSFTGLEARSFAAQQKPYKPFGQIGDRQSLLHYGNQAGTGVGFRMPKTIGPINVPGYHFHFITNDRKRGGHVLGFSTFTGTVRLQKLAYIDQVTKLVSGEIDSE